MTEALAYKNTRSKADEDTFLADVIHGLSASPKRLPCKYFYDERGSQLFEKICELDEYYVTRTEWDIFVGAQAELVQLIGANANVIEPGSGAGKKIRLLLKNLPSPSSYLPWEISYEFLMASAQRIREEFRALDVMPIHGDFTQQPDQTAIHNLRLRQKIKGGRNIVFFPGSTIGNFEHEQAITLLRQFSSLAGRDGALIVGIDLVKNAEVLERAYDDKAGITADFNINLLHRANRELDADFDIDNGFTHQAIFNHEQSRIEMHLLSTKDQVVAVGNHKFGFNQGETIHTENSHKYSLNGFSELVQQAGLRVKRIWRDQQDYFALTYLESAADFAS